MSRDPNSPGARIAAAGSVADRLLWLDGMDPDNLDMDFVNHMDEVHGDWLRGVGTDPFLADMFEKMGQDMEFFGDRLADVIHDLQHQGRGDMFIATIARPEVLDIQYGRASFKVCPKGRETVSGTDMSAIADHAERLSQEAVVTWKEDFERRRLDAFRS